MGILLGLFSLLNGPALSRLGEGVAAKEDVGVEDIPLISGQIALTIRNQGPETA